MSALAILLVSALQAAADTPNVEHLIVAPRAFVETLAPFAEFRASHSPHLKGSAIVALEDAIAAEEGRDDAERLKRYLYRRHRDDGVRSCLLVGDCDVMPMRSMTLDRATAPAFHWAFYPCDLYYGDVAKADGSFDDWNAGNAGFHARYFGEVHGETIKTGPINFDQVDYRPEIAIGRWPASNADEARAMAEKTMAYERALDVAAADAKPVVAFFAVGGWVDVRDRVRGFGARLKGRADVRLFVHDSEGEPKPDETAMRATLASAPRFVFHSGHGQPWGWEQCLRAETFEGIDVGGALPILMSAGCSTSEVMTQAPYQPYDDVYGVPHAGTNAGEVFTSPPPAPNVYQRGAHNTTSLAEALLRKPHAGAVATIGCVTGSQPAAVSLMDGFTEALASGAPTLGDCWRHAITRYCEIERLDTLVPTPDWYPPSVYFQGMKFVVLGDPGLRTGLTN
ncbi:MAG: hypothetical protein JNM94_09735 [Phycisphaerae bacterium]|nr:hypothetical protein [Phycisphaerae bacterium]